MSTDRVEIARVDDDPKNPDLVATLKVQPPLKYPDADPDSYRARTREDWTLGSLERTCLELRAAGGWDTSKVDLGHQELTCEILAHPGAEVLPWGWVPAHGTPPQQRSTNVTVDVPPIQLPAKVTWLVYGVAALAAVDLIARIVGWLW